MIEPDAIMPGRGAYLRFAAYMDFRTYKRLHGFAPVRYLLERFVFPRFPVLNLETSGPLRIILEERIRASVTRKVKDKNGEQRSWASLVYKERVKRTRGRLRMQFPGGNDAALLSAFQDILEKCREKGITVIGVRYPLSPVYRKFLKQYDLREAEKLFYNSGLTIHDYSNAYEGEEYFSDMDHLNAEAAGNFAKSIQGLIGGHKRAPGMLNGGTQ